MNRVLALILAGGAGERLSILSEERAKPAVVFGGKYRIIDFTLSNCVNSGITRVGVLTQYRPRSLNQHIATGRPWDLDRNEGGVFLLQPYTGRRSSDWYKGTADAVFQNLGFIEESRRDQVLILAGDHVYEMRYEEMIAFHRAKGADVTVGMVEIPWEETYRFGVMTLDEEGRVVAFEEKVPQAQSNLASMGIYVFNREILKERLQEDARKRTSHDFGGDIIPAMVERDKVYGYPFRGYWRDVGTIEAYWQANMDLLQDLPPLNLYDPGTAVYTKELPRPPAKFGPSAQVGRSLICPGCIVNGIVHHSVLSPGVYVEEGATVADSIILNDTVVCRDAVIHRAIIDKEVWVGPGSHVGHGDDYTPNHSEPQNLSTGITLVGKGAKIPAGVYIGRNCKIHPGVQESHFTGAYMASGETINGLPAPLPKASG